MTRVAALIVRWLRPRAPARPDPALRLVSFRHGAAEDPTDPGGRCVVDDRGVVAAKDVVSAAAIALPLIALLGAAVAFATG